jgi:protein-L-isoaspartate(D-aspartate) O-methyltransferase
MADARLRAADRGRRGRTAAVTHLGPLVTDAEDAGQLTRWWFVRKGESWWLRFQPAPGHDEMQALPWATS